MIVGNGLIALSFKSYFEDDPNVIIFASGVSNSAESNRVAFLREQNMLEEALTLGKYICYFSTCSVNDPELANSPYVIHKKKMETLVCLVDDYAIFRLPQVVGKTSNPNTLANYIYNQISSEKHFKIWRNARRNLIDVKDVASITAHLIRNSLAHRVTENIACTFSIEILQLVKIFENLLDKKASYSFVDAGSAYSIYSELATKAAIKIGISFDKFYVESMLRKYYVE